MGLLPLRGRLPRRPTRRRIDGLLVLSAASCHLPRHAEQQLSSCSSIRDNGFANLCSSAHSLPLVPHGASVFLAGRRFGLEAKSSAYVASECAKLNSINLWRVPFYRAMRCKKSKKQKDKETLAEVFKEMAQPRFVKSARRYKEYLFQKVKPGRVLLGSLNPD